MAEFLIQLLFFPAMLVSLIVSVIGVLKDKYWLIILGAILFLPMSYYLNGSPGSRGFAILLPLFQIVSAAAVREKNKVWAWILLVPAFIAGLWIVGVALWYQLR